MLVANRVAHGAERAHVVMDWLRRRNRGTALQSLTDDDWRHLIVNGASRYAGVRLPAVPPPAMQHRFNAPNDSGTNLAVGFAYYQTIRDAAARHGRPLERTSRVLDFGCGWGRVLRCFLHDVDAGNLTGIDVDGIGIDSCRSTFEGATFEVTPRWPPTGLPSDTFDLVYAVSVFSHLPEALHLAWLAEIRRVLRPGGVFVGSTLSRSEIERSDQFPDGSLAAFDTGGFVFVPRPQPEYGLAVIPPAYIARAWPAYLDVLEVIPPGLTSQTVVVGRRVI